MSKRNQDKGRQPPWISVFKHTWKSAAWKMLSVGARALYVELAANYNTKMMNSVFMSARTGAEKLNTRKNNIILWMRELEHYGFIVKISGPFLGLDGEGKSAHYRLTDRWYGNKGPTYDFQNWDGVVFESPKREHNAAEISRLGSLKQSRKKSDPVPRPETPRLTARDIGNNGPNGKSGNKRTTARDIGNGAECTTARDISSFNHMLSLNERGPDD